MNAEKRPISLVSTPTSDRRSCHPLASSGKLRAGARSAGWWMLRRQRRLQRIMRGRRSVRVRFAVRLQRLPHVHLHRRGDVPHRPRRRHHLQLRAMRRSGAHLRRRLPDARRFLRARSLAGRLGKLLPGRRRHRLQRHVRERRRVVLVRHRRPLEHGPLQPRGARRRGDLLRRSRLALLRLVHVQRGQVRDGRELGRLRLLDLRERQSLVVLGHGVLRDGQLHRRLVPVRRERRVLRDRRDHGQQLSADGDSLRPGPDEGRRLPLTTSQDGTPCDRGLRPRALNSGDPIPRDFAIIRESTTVARFPGR